MHDFLYKKNELYCEKVPVSGIAKETGTPFYLYSRHTLENHFKVFDSAFSSIPHLTCFSVKANGNLAILKIFTNLGGGADVVSGGELYRALSVDISPKKIVYSGVGKKESEIEYALEADILMFNVESSQELSLINRVASRVKKKARIALRVNPDIDPRTHPYIATGLRENKFGINFTQAFNEYAKAQRLKNVEITGVDCHIGSQIVEVSPFLDALKRLKTLMNKLKKIGINIQYLDLGGGLGIRYDKEEPPHPRDYAQSLMKELKGLKVTLILEPGRVIVGNAGILVTQVLYTKKSPKKNFVIVDAGMNDLIRPSLYGAYQMIQPVIRAKRGKMVADVVGPICESGDFLARNREIPKLKAGELIAIMGAGAYGFSMSSNYNSRPRIAEVLVDNDRFSIIRERESYDDLVRGERIPEGI
jgi:diaminopimelate decarboxylase